MAETILTNAKIILENEVINGTLVFADGVIRTADAGRSSVASAQDMEGDFVAPGLIEMHTDNMEKHFVPRPGVFWPDPLAAAKKPAATMLAVAAMGAGQPGMPQAPPSVSSVFSTFSASSASSSNSSALFTCPKEP